MTRLDEVADPDMSADTAPKREQGTVTYLLFLFEIQLGALRQLEFFRDLLRELNSDTNREVIRRAVYRDPPDRRPRGGVKTGPHGGEPSPWLENAVRALEDRYL